MVSSDELANDGATDIQVLAAASRAGRAVLTADVRDFEALHRAGHQHCGILTVYQDNDRRDMRIEEFAPALAAIDRAHPELQNCLVPVNNYRQRRQ